MVKKAEKLLESARRSPAGWMPHQLERLYKGFGFRLRQAKGSHVNVSHPDYPDLRASYPVHPRELGKAYIATAVKLIDQLLRYKKDKEENE